MNNIKVFKLTTGDEIIAKVVSSPENVIPNWKIEKARMIIMQQTQAGHIGLGLLPWLASNVDGEVEIYSSALVLVPFSPDVNLENEYIQQTTGIAIAT